MLLAGDADRTNCAAIDTGLFQRLAVGALERLDPPLWLLFAPPVGFADQRMGRIALTAYNALVGIQDHHLGALGPAVHAEIHG